MIVGPLQFERSENAVEGLRASTCVARHAPAGTGVVRLLAVAVIGVEALLDGKGGQAERLAPDRRFQSLQVEAVQALAAQQRFDIPEDLSGEQAGERGFFYCHRLPIRPGEVARRRFVRIRRLAAEPVGGNDGTPEVAGAFAAPRARPE